MDEHRVLRIDYVDGFGFKVWSFRYTRIPGGTRRIAEYTPTERSLERLQQLTRLVRDENPETVSTTGRFARVDVEFNYNGVSTEITTHAAIVTG